MKISETNIRLIVRSLNNELTKEEQVELSEWLDSNPAHKKNYYRIKDVWDTMYFNKIRKNISVEDDWDKLLLKASDIELQKSKKKQSAFINKKSYINIRRAVQIAAVFIIALGMGIFLNRLLPEQEEFATINVPYGAKTQLDLPDGSKVWINSGSSLTYPVDLEQKNTTLFLEGEAYFDISKIKGRQLNVKTSTLTVQVHGTSFNVCAYPNDKRSYVTLVEGSVMLFSNTKKWTTNLIPGQSSFVVEGGGPQILNTNTDIYTSWKEDKIVFRKETLEEIAKKMERWYNVEIIFKDEELRNFKFSGTFLKHKPVEQVFKSLNIMNKHIDFVFESRPDQKDIIYIIKNN